MDGTKPEQHTLTIEELEASVRVRYEDLVTSKPAEPKRPTADYEDDQTRLLREAGGA